MMLKFLSLRQVVLICSSFIIHNTLYGSEITNTQIKIKRMDTEITTLKHRLTQDHHKQHSLEEELAITEQAIGNNIKKLRDIQQMIKDNQKEITALEDKITTLKKQQTQQQRQLAKYLIARYKMGENKPLQWLIDVKNYHHISRLFTFYSYIIHSQQQLITQLKQTTTTLILSQKNLQYTLEKHQQLQQHTLYYQQQLEQEKKHHLVIMQTLKKTIHSEEEKLQIYQRDKAKLTQLLQTLVKQSKSRYIPFNRLQHKLPRPIQHALAIKSINQGVVFLANEGTPVFSVYPGKVVFSDWLRGYGLLLIIDHGQGFMTLYAHNQSLFKNKGEHVEEGEQIATIGHSGGLNENGLYFEIRQRGKAITPMEWLS